MRRIIAFLMMITTVFALSGCFLLSSSGSKREEDNLLNYLENDQTVVAARVWSEDRYSDDTLIIEASEDQLDDLVEEIKKTPIKDHFGHADYFYSGWYGIELTLSDGTYLIYDCTCLEHSKAPYDAEYDPENRIKRDYIEDKGRDFWDRIEKYFPGMEDGNFSYGW